MIIKTVRYVVILSIHPIQMNIVQSICDLDTILLTSCCGKLMHQCCALMYFKPRQIYEDAGISETNKCPLCNSLVSLSLESGKFNSRGVYWKQNNSSDN